VEGPNVEQTSRLAEAGRVPVQRDSFYNVVRRFD